MFDRKRGGTQGTKLLRRSQSFERPTRSSARRAVTVADNQEKLFDRKRLVAAASATGPPAWAEW